MIETMWFYWRCILAFPRMIRLAWRVALWNIGTYYDPEDALRRTPNALEEYERIRSWIVRT